MKKNITHSIAILLFAFIVSSATCKKEEAKEQSPSERDLRGGIPKKTFIDLAFLGANNPNQIEFTLEFGANGYLDKTDIITPVYLSEGNTIFWRSSSADVIEPSTPILILRYDTAHGEIYAGFKNAVADTFMATKFGRTVSYIIPKDSVPQIFFSGHLSNIPLDSIRRATNRILNGISVSKKYVSAANN